MTQQLHVAGLPRDPNNGCFDTANAIKSCVRVRGGQSSEFPIYPTTRERTIKVVCMTRFQDGRHITKEGYKKVGSYIQPCNVVDGIWRSFGGAAYWMVCNS